VIAVLQSRRTSRRSGVFERAAERIARCHAQIADALDALADIDLRELDQDELTSTLVDVHRLQARTDAHVTDVVGAVDRYWGQDVQPVSWIAHKCRIKPSKAKAALARSRALRHMPEVKAAYDAGAMSSEHVALLAAASRSNRDAFEKAEEELVDDAQRLAFVSFDRRVAYFRQIADPDGCEAEAQDAFERRSLFAARTFESTVDAKALFDPIGGTIWRNELDRLERQLFEEDWKEARERLGDDATFDDLRRTSGQRRLDAQVEMARRSAALPEGGVFNRPLITVLVGYETFAGRICQLADGTVVTPGQVVPLLSDADIERVVFDGPSRVIDVGAKQRLFRGATRRSVEVRDLFCTEETCDVPYERADIDHIRPWALGGPTTHDNGRVRCPRHNPGRRKPYQPPPDDD
jgi:hypothetical protein